MQRNCPDFEIIDDGNAIIATNNNTSAKMHPPIAMKQNAIYSWQLKFDFQESEYAYMNWVIAKLWVLYQINVQILERIREWNCRNYREYQQWKMFGVEQQIY